jgi:two-component system, OmpR family, KDP operon response regulator KdpE
MSGAVRILVADDDVEARSALVQDLHQHGYQTAPTTLAGAPEVARAFRPDLVLLETAGAAGATGDRVARCLQAHSDPLLVFVTGDVSTSTCLVAFEAGADDYVTKPFSVDELLARLRAALRRGGAPADPVIEIGELRIDVANRDVRLGEERLKLTPHEFDLLRVLAQNEGKLLTHRTLLREVWGPAYQVEAHYLHVYVSHLRRKIEPDPQSPRYLLTEPRAGYRLVDPKG